MTNDLDFEYFDCEYLNLKKMFNINKQQQQKKP